MLTESPGRECPSISLACSTCGNDEIGVDTSGRAQCWFSSKAAKSENPSDNGFSAACPVHAARRMDGACGKISLSYALCPTIAQCFGPRESETATLSD